MAVLQMQRISICAMKKNRKAILEELQSLGVLEIDAEELDPELKTMDTMNARLIFEKNASLCDQAIEILDEFSKEKGSMLASLAGKPLIGRKQEEEAIRDQEEILGQPERSRGTGRNSQRTAQQLLRSNSRKRHLLHGWIWISP